MKTNLKNTLGYYANTAVNLSNLAYDTVSKINGDVNSYNPSLSVVWGPAQHFTNGFSDSLLYVACDNTSHEYYVVIRGTLFSSLYDWFDEDFDVEYMYDMHILDSRIPIGTTISHGAFNGINRLINLIDSQSNKTLIQFLKSVNPTNIIVTGHSLGGTLTPPLFVYINALLYNPKAAPTNMGLFSFAGLTAGGASFNSYLNSLLQNYSWQWRFHNNLDVAPLLIQGNNYNAVETIYSSYKQIQAPDKGECFLIYGLFYIANNQYSQPTGKDMQLNGTIDNRYLTWFTQLEQQHHASPTYVNLVKNAFPLSKAKKSIKPKAVKTKMNKKK